MLIHDSIKTPTRFIGFCHIELACQLTTNQDIYQATGKIFPIGILIHENVARKWRLISCERDSTYSLCTNLLSIPDPYQVYIRNAIINHRDIYYFQPVSIRWKTSSQKA